jgi:hypothetical protein
MKPHELSIRYVHQQFDDHKKYSGFTIAYSRTDDRVFFAYSLCSKKDQFVKEHGRVHAEITYYGTEFELDDPLYLDAWLQKGSLPLHIFTKNLPDEVTFAIGDHFIDDMTMNDFKHAFISKVLAGIVYEVI